MEDEHTAEEHVKQHEVRHITSTEWYIWVSFAFTLLCIGIVYAVVVDNGHIQEEVQIRSEYTDDLRNTSREGVNMIHTRPIPQDIHEETNEFVQIPQNQTDKLVYTTSEVPCIDSDSGIDPQHHGVVTGAGRMVETDENGMKHVKDGNVHTSYDQCVATEGYVEHEGETLPKRLLEKYCGVDNRIAVETITCEKGCKGGMCVQDKPSGRVSLQVDWKIDEIKKEYDSKALLAWEAQGVDTCDVTSEGLATELWNESDIPTAGVKMLKVGTVVATTSISIACKTPEGDLVTDSVNIVSIEGTP